MSTFNQPPTPQPPPVPQAAHLDPHRGTMILTFGIIGFVFLGILFGPLAWAFGTIDLAAMDRGEMDPSGRGLTQAGRICGIVVTVLNIVGLLVGVVTLAIVFSMAVSGA